jgi:hypothetical protein
MTPANLKHFRKHCCEAIRLCGCRGNLFTLDSLRTVLANEYGCVPERALIQTWLREKTFLRGDGWTWELLGPTVR